MPSVEQVQYELNDRNDQLHQTKGVIHDPSFLHWIDFLQSIEWRESAEWLS